MQTCTWPAPPATLEPIHSSSPLKPVGSLLKTLERYFFPSSSNATSNFALLTSTPIFEFICGFPPERAIRRAHPDMRGHRRLVKPAAPQDTIRATASNPSGPHS